MKTQKENQNKTRGIKEMYIENQVCSMDEDLDKDFCSTCTERVDRCRCFEIGVERLYYRR